MRPPPVEYFRFYESIWQELVDRGSRQGLNRYDAEDVAGLTMKDVEGQWYSKYAALPEGTRRAYCCRALDCRVKKFWTAVKKTRDRRAALGLPVAQTAPATNPLVFAQDSIDWDQVPAPQDEYECDDLDEEVRRRLSHQQREIWRLREEVGLPAKVAAERLGITTNSVGKQLSRARDKLRPWAEDYRNID